MSNPRARRVKQTPIHRNNTLRGDGTETAEALVFCRSRKTSVSVETCAGCPDCVEMRKPTGEGGVVACWTETLELDRLPAHRPGGRVDFRESALRSHVGEVMRGGLVSVTPDTSVDAVAALFTEGAVRTAPVVDDSGKLVGIVSLVDVLRWRQRRGASEEDRSNAILCDDPVHERVERTVDEIMTPLAHALPDGAPLAYAFGLLAAENLREVPVVAEDGRVVGMLTSTDLLCWAARDLGYVL
jgi:CBS domain-containing protein